MTAPEMVSFLDAERKKVLAGGVEVVDEEDEDEEE
jgi:hypothetical protein